MNHVSDSEIKTSFCQKLWKALDKYRFVHTPYPHEKVSLQIYTDLKNGPENSENFYPRVLKKSKN